MSVPLEQFNLTNRPFVCYFINLGQGDQAEATESKTGYFCPDCRTTVDLAGIDLLRHQRKHQQEKTEPEAD